MHSGGLRGVLRVSIEPPFWLDLLLTSTDDWLSGTLLPGWRTKELLLSRLSMP